MKAMRRLAWCPVRGSILAALVANVLVLQAFVAAWALTLPVARADGPAYFLCTPFGLEAGPSDPAPAQDGPAHDGVDLHCLAACQALALLGLALPGNASSVTVAPRARSHRPRPARSDRPRRRIAGSPAQARAPPRSL